MKVVMDISDWMVIALTLLFFLGVGRIVWSPPAGGAPDHPLRDPHDWVSKNGYLNQPDWMSRFNEWQKKKRNKKH